VADFKTYYPKLLKWEGGYASADFAKKQGDKGGETYLGIARNYNPNWDGWRMIDAYVQKNGEPKWNSHIPDPAIDASAQSMSKQLYWDKLKLDSVKNQSLAEFIMDYGFNSGLGTPVKAIQGILGLNKDGVMGNDTINKINTADTDKLFSALQQNRVNLISGLKFSDQVKGGLLNRAKSFAYDHKGIAIATGVGLFFFIGVGVAIWLVYRSKL